MANTVPPVIPAPVVIPPIDKGTGRFTQVWAQWFTNVYNQVIQPIQNAVNAGNSTGILVNEGNNSYSIATITGTNNQIVVVNGNGVSGNPTISLPNTITIGSVTPRTTGSISLISNDGYTQTLVPITNPGQNNAYTLPNTSGTIALTNAISTPEVVYLGSLGPDISGTGNQFYFSSSNVAFSNYNTYKVRWRNVSLGSTTDSLTLLLNTNSTGEYTSNTGGTAYTTSHGWKLQVGASSTSYVSAGWVEVFNCQATIAGSFSCLGMDNNSALPGSTGTLAAPILISGNCNTFNGPITNIGMVTISSGNGAGSNMATGTFDIYGING